MTRELIVSDDVGQLLDASAFAQIEQFVDDDDNVCGRCGAEIRGDAATVVVSVDRDTQWARARLAHPRCQPSGVFEVEGLGAELVARFAQGLDVNTRLGARESSPRRLLFVELVATVAGPGEDPVARWAEQRGFIPVNADIEAIDPPLSERVCIEPHPGGLRLRHGAGVDVIAVPWPLELDSWCFLEDGCEEVVAVIGRGLGLGRQVPRIEEALLHRPVWAAKARLRGVPTARGS